MSATSKVLALVLAACAPASSAPVPVETAPATLPAAVAAPTVPPHRSGDASAALITRVRIAAAVDDGVATTAPAYARVDQRVTLHAVIVADGVVYSDAPKLRLGQHTVAPRPLAAAPRAALHWQRIEPAVATMTNGDGAAFRFAPIEYRATAIDADNAPAITADVRPTLTPDHGQGVGTMRYQLVVVQGARTIASPGAEARRGKGSGGLTDDVMRVSVRRDDTYLGYLTEMFGQPYIWASAGLGDRVHQSERLEGSDCADFIVYGARRTGKALPYTWTGALPAVTRRLGGGTRDADGVYRDARGAPVTFTRPGDLVLWPRHVGALVEDRGVTGVLDDADLVMHTLFDSPKTVPIADTGYADKPTELRRFR